MKLQRNHPLNRGGNTANHSLYQRRRNLPPHPMNFRDKFFGGKRPVIRDLLGEEEVIPNLEEDVILVRDGPIPRVIVHDRLEDKLKEPWKKLVVVKLMGQSITLLAGDHQQGAQIEGQGSGSGTEATEQKRSDVGPKTQAKGRATGENLNSGEMPSSGSVTHRSLQIEPKTIRETGQQVQIPNQRQTIETFPNAIPVSSSLHPEKHIAVMVKATTKKSSAMEISVGCDELEERLKERGDDGAGLMDDPGDMKWTSIADTTVNRRTIEWMRMGCNGEPPSGISSQ
ncbi:OLC1v1008361C1 [Oldenlandia corymbosa var. corymbosa]|uniref:OLC1v1008361C1 n=1 Tax=Oldenlandia corymbosa var. corymbosa TaxID=529605 RepID=A0AAV1DLY9_OLDCO|nr:OLC1v1008361C1 [Oldenlandia corymbosa var. corymbosa]